MLSPRTFAALALAVAACSKSGPPPMAEQRLTPQELARLIDNDGNQIGSSGLKGVHTKVLFGDPAKPGLYSILLFVPPNTKIEAHSHRDDRMATVVSGTWRLGYGDRYDASGLKTLPPGSVYSEPGTTAHNHYAQTGREPVIVHIVGYGPTDTQYVDPAHAPKPPPR